MRRDLEIREAAAMRAPIGQQAVDRIEAVADTLAVVEAVDADDQIAIPQALAQTARIRCRDGARRQLGELLRRDADREGGNARLHAVRSETAVSQPTSARTLGDVVE